MSSTLPQLCTLSGQTVDRKRRGVSAYVGGRLVDGTDTLTTGYFASVQPPNGDHINYINQSLEGTRTKAWISVYCELNTFREADDRNNIRADIVIFEGNEYEVQRATHRTGRHLNHDMILAVRLD
jgi:hypothetical protein